MMDFQALEHFLDQKYPAEIDEGIVASKSLLTAWVRLGGSNQMQEASLPKDTMIDVGDRVIVIRPTRMSRWVILTAFGTRQTGIVVSGESNPAFEFAPPDGVAASSVLLGCVLFTWDAPPQQVVAFEVQTNTSESEAGATSQLITRGSYCIIQSSVTLYGRVRSISTTWEKSDWSDWVSAAPGTSLPDGITTLRVAKASFAYNTSSPLLVTNVAANAHIVEVRLLIDTAFNGTVSLTIGEPGATSRLMAASENDPTEIGSYQTTPDYTYPGAADINLYLSAAGATQGAGRVILLYQE